MDTATESNDYTTQSESSGSIEETAEFASTTVADVTDIDEKETEASVALNNLITIPTKPSEQIDTQTTIQTSSCSIAMNKIQNLEERYYENANHKEANYC